MDTSLERNLGEQPLARILAERELSHHDLVAASAGRCNHKMVARAAKGRRLTPRTMYIVLDALVAATGEGFALEDLFNYGAGGPPPRSERPSRQAALNREEPRSEP